MCAFKRTRHKFFCLAIFVSQKIDGLVDLYYSEKDFFELMDDFWKKKPTGIWHKANFLLMAKC